MTKIQLDTKEIEISFYINLLLATGKKLPVLHKVYFSNKYTLVYKLGFSNNNYQNFIELLWEKVRDPRYILNLTNLGEIAYYNLLLNMQKTNLTPIHEIDDWEEINSFLKNKYNILFSNEELFNFINQLLLIYEDFQNQL